MMAPLGFELLKQASNSQDTLFSFYQFTVLGEASPRKSWFHAAPVNAFL